MMFFYQVLSPDPIYLMYKGIRPPEYGALHFIIIIIISY